MTSGRSQVAFRISPEEIEELDAIVELAASGSALGRLSRSDIIRRALSAGLPRVRREIEAMVASVEQLDT